MNLIDVLITVAPLAAGGWAAWWVPRWAGQGRPGPTTGRTDWATGGDLPSQPYRDLHRLP